MTVVLRTDSDNYVHQLWAQDQAATCAVASIWMARNQAKQSTATEDEWSLAWRLYNRVVLNCPSDLIPFPPAPRTFNASSFANDEKTFANKFSNFGTFMQQVIDALKLDGLKVNSSTAFSKGTQIDKSKLSDTTPAIVLLGWYNGAKRNGGHFIVASRVTSKGSIVYLDPWGGQLSEAGTGPQYQTTGVFEQVTYISR
ncbi:hypothetical protein GCM10007036_23500 [Alsobacter metallidurans]|uniref:Uncharacterized protein n=1 Tax=Alsobacter metallidurans TaxID=340221 RepID=A0A917I6P2_9HYPH|nr:hypothetical protein [Alsobacter metallidurans]GGH20131.1 hypothetical protein GCM10007036_23500 [Alsobacter metallidurans]